MTDAASSLDAVSHAPAFGAHIALATAPATTPDDHEPCSSPRLCFERVYAAWFTEVSRWVRAQGGLSADVDDLTQDVFLVVRRKLPEFDGANLGGWLYRITRRTVRDYRRAAWFRRFLLKEGPPLDTSIRSSALDPSQILERRQSQQIVEELLGRMTSKRRSIFILFEIEGYSGEEIAHREGIPVNTVWTRLYHARRDFVALLEARQREPPP